MEKVSIKTVASYGGHNVNQVKNISLTLKFTYDTISKYIQSIQMLNENVTIIAVVDGQKIKLGSFMINSISIDHDGAGKIKFKSQVDYVELENITKIISNDAFKVAMIAEIDVDEENKEEEEENEEKNKAC